MGKIDGKNIGSLEELLALTGNNFNVLEEEIDIETQHRYVMMTKVMQHRQDYKEVKEVCAANIDRLFDEQTPEEEKQKMLTVLADIPEPAVYRTIESFSKMDTPLKQWATIALQQSRIRLQSSLMDDPGIFISTGLGGQGSLLRFFAVLLHQTGKMPEDYQQKMLQNELEAAVRKAGGELENIEHDEAFTTALLLMPLDAELPDILSDVITECNQYGNFLHNKMIITNVKKLSKQEISELIKKAPSNQPGPQEP